MSKLAKKNFDTPDDTLHPADKITAEMVELNGQQFHRITAQPDWRWTVDLKPVMKTDSCQTDHLLYVISGRMVVRMDDGQEMEYGPGDIAAIPPGHDGWGLDGEPTVWVELPH